MSIDVKAEGARAWLESLMRFSRRQYGPGQGETLPIACFLITRDEQTGRRLEELRELHCIIDPDIINGPGVVQWLRGIAWYTDAIGFALLAEGTRRSLRDLYTEEAPDECFQIRGEHDAAGRFLYYAPINQDPDGPHLGLWQGGLSGPLDRMTSFLPKLTHTVQDERTIQGVIDLCRDRSPAERGKLIEDTRRFMAESSSDPAAIDSICRKFLFRLRDAGYEVDAVPDDWGEAGWKAASLPPGTALFQKGSVLILRPADKEMPQYVRVR